MQRISYIVARVQDALGGIERTAGPILDLAIRWWLASIFWVSGILKAANWQTALELARNEYPVSWMDPAAAAYLGASIELICPVFLSVGLATRLAAIPMLVLSLVIQFSYKALPDHLFWAMLLAWLVVRGPGALSVDHFIAPAIRRLAVPLIVPLADFTESLTRFAGPVVAAAAIALEIAHADRAGETYWLLLLGRILIDGPGALSLGDLAGRLLRLIPGPSLARAPHVVIVGAGFGGLAAARALRFAPARVTVIDRRNYHLFQPLLYQVATASLSPADIASPIREILRDQHNTRVMLGRVAGVDTGRRLVQVEGAADKVPYDYLVLATGARHSYFGKDAWEKDAPGLKKIDDATAIRRRILLAFERAEAASDPAERARLLTFVIVGAGPTGVELAGAIAELARFGMEKEFRNFDPAGTRVILVQSGPRVLPVFPESLSGKAQKSLEALGVEVRLNGKVGQVDERGVLIGNERIEAATVLWAAGVIASSAAKWIGAEADRAGRIKVAADLSVPGLSNVYAIGDTALAHDAAGNPLPGLAPAAKQGGEYIGKLIHARITDAKSPGPFRYRHLGSMATIGLKAAIADFGFMRLSGLVAWWLWGGVHVAFLVGARNRMAVMLDWAWAYLTYRRGIRLITGAGLD